MTPTVEIVCSDDLRVWPNDRAIFSLVFVAHFPGFQERGSLDFEFVRRPANLIEFLDYINAKVLEGKFSWDDNPVEIAQNVFVFESPDTEDSFTVYAPDENEDSIYAKVCDATVYARFAEVIAKKLTR